MLTLLEVLRRTADYLGSKGVESPRLEAEWLLASVLGLKRLDLYLQFERPLGEGELDALRPLVRRRAGREPLQYVLGETEFCGLTLKTDRRALIPRPETERLAELVGRRVNGPPGRILDLGTGTGALAFALLHTWPEAVAVAVDRSDEALSLARENAVALGLVERVKLVCSDWYAGLAGEEPFDLIVANPPYLTAEEWRTAEPEVREYEPREALEAERSGLAALEAVVAGAGPFLRAGGLVALETGVEHCEPLADHAARHGFGAVEAETDYHERDRYLFLRITEC